MKSITSLSEKVVKANGRGRVGASSLVNANERSKRKGRALPGRGSTM